jgi:hypothetical protein
VEEFTNVVRIHGRYMKAILRRARCYSRLQQMAESVKRPIGIVSQCRLHLSWSARCQGCGDRTSKGGIEQCPKAKRHNEVTKSRPGRSGASSGRSSEAISRRTLRLRWTKFWRERENSHVCWTHVACFNDKDNRCAASKAHISVLQSGWVTLGIRRSCGATFASSSPSWEGHWFSNGGK